MDKRKEFTQNLVSNLKSKITEFKNKKNKDRAERKNELDFEINKDLVNKFKKNPQTSLQNNPQPQNPLSLNGSSPKEIPSSNLLFNIKGNNDSLKQPLPSQNPPTPLLSNLLKPKPPTTSSELPKTSLNKSRDHININNNPPSSQAQISSKRTDIMNTLLSNNKSIPKKNSFSYASSLPPNKQTALYNYSSNYTNPPSTKDKIHNIMYNLDNKQGSGLGKEQKIPKYVSNTYADSKYEPSVKERKVYVSSKYGTKRNEGDGLGDFADFSWKNNNNKQRTFSSDSLIFMNELPKKKEEKGLGSISQSEVRGLAGKIRFLTNDDIRGMDRAVVEELVSLSNLIKRTFENK